MKRLHVGIIGSALLLAACIGGATVTYTTTFDVQDPAQRTQLLLMSQRVIERMLASMGEKGTVSNVEPTAEGATITVDLGDPIVADVLTSQLTQPFTLEVMKEAVPEKADITVAGHGAFAKTGIDQSHLQWVTAAPQQGTDFAMVTMSFSDEGRKMLEKLFRENKNKFVGIFVRDRLVSKLKVVTDKLEKDVVIQDIPSYPLAEAFADDVNVGLHASFVPVP